MAVAVGFIGLGNMGNPMAGNVLKSGFPLTVYDKNPKAMENLVRSGAKAAASAKEAVESAEVVLTSLPGSPEVEALYLERRRSHRVRQARERAGRSEQRAAFDAAPARAAGRARGVQFLEAPVSGGVTGAQAATLAVMTGGDAAVLERVRPILRSIGPNIYHVGAVGAGNTVKAINNMMASVNALAMMEGMVLGVKAGLDLKTIYEIVKASSGNSNALAAVPRTLIPRNFEPGFKVQLMNKDLETFNTIAKELHVPVSFSNIAQRYQQAALAAGFGEQDTSVIYTIIERLAAVTPARD